MADVGGAPDETRVRMHLHSPEGDDDADELPESSGKIGRDAFAGLFCGAFSIPKLVKGPTYAPLEITPDREQAALTTGRVAFDLLERYAPFLIPPDTAISAEMFVALGFCRTQWSIYVDIKRAEAQAREKAAEAIDATAPESGNGGAA